MKVMCSAHPQVILQKKQLAMPACCLHGLNRTVDGSAFGRPRNVLTLGPGGFIAPLAENTLFCKLVRNWGDHSLSQGPISTALMPGNHVHAGVMMVIDRAHELIM